MLNFETYLMRHGEVALEAMLENWERFRGLRSSATLTLEERWVRFVSETNTSNAPISMAA